MDLFFFKDAPCWQREAQKVEEKYLHPLPNLPGKNYWLGYLMMCTYLLKYMYTGNSKNPPNCTFFSHPCTRPVGFPSCQTVPVPVPTQIQNYQRLKQNLQLVDCTRYMKLLHRIGIRSWLIVPLPQSISVFTGARSVVLNLPMQQLNVPDRSSYPQQVSFPADFWLPSEL